MSDKPKTARATRRRRTTRRLNRRPIRVPEDRQQSTLQNRRDPSGASQGDGSSTDIGQPGAGALVRERVGLGESSATVGMDGEIDLLELLADSTPPPPDQSEDVSPPTLQGQSDGDGVGEYTLKPAQGQGGALEHDVGHDGAPRGVGLPLPAVHDEGSHPSESRPQQSWPGAEAPAWSGAGASDEVSGEGSVEPALAVEQVSGFKAPKNVADPAVASAGLQDTTGLGDPRQASRGLEGHPAQGAPGWEQDRGLSTSDRGVGGARQGRSPWDPAGSAVVDKGLRESGEQPTLTAAPWGGVSPEQLRHEGADERLADEQSVAGRAPTGAPPPAGAWPHQEVLPESEQGQHLAPIQPRPTTRVSELSHEHGDDRGLAISGSDASQAFDERPGLDAPLESSLDDLGLEITEEVSLLAGFLDHSDADELSEPLLSADDVHRARGGSAVVVSRPVQMISDSPRPPEGFDFEAETAKPEPQGAAGLPPVPAPAASTQEVELPPAPDALLATRSQVFEEQDVVVDELDGLDVDRGAVASAGAPQPTNLESVFESEVELGSAAVFVEEDLRPEFDAPPSRPSGSWSVPGSGRPTGSWSVPDAGAAPFEEDGSEDYVVEEQLPIGMAFEGDAEDFVAPPPRVPSRRGEPPRRTDSGVENLRRADTDIERLRRADSGVESLRPGEASLEGVHPEQIESAALRQSWSADGIQEAVDELTLEDGDVEESLELESELANAASEAFRTVPPPPPPKRRPPPPPAATAAPVPSRRPRPKRAVGWWETLFSEDYLQTYVPPTPEQVARQCDFFWDVLDLKRGQTVLDVGCGLGLHAVELTRRGCLVVGIDLSLPMITRAAEAAQQQNLRINFLHADIREIEFEGTFDAVLCVGTTFGFFDDQENAEVLQRMYAALRPSGKLLLDVTNRDYVLASQPNLVWFQGDNCLCMEESDFNYFTSQLSMKRTLMQDDGRQSEVSYALRLYSLHELGQLLRHVGFRVLEVSGHEATRSVFFGCHSTRMIVLASRSSRSSVGR